jgi:hypothetical protein
MASGNPSKTKPQNTVIGDIRKQQWHIYKENFTALQSKLNAVSQRLKSEEKINISTIKLSDFGQAYDIKNIKEYILVPQNTHLAQMSCVDEATQLGEFIDERNVGGQPLGTVSDPSTPRYVIDFPGSGALAYECVTTDIQELSKNDFLKIEDERLSITAQRIVNWCKSRDIIKFTVTYHCDCGAISRRINRHPEICPPGELETAKKCAFNIANKIDIKAKEVNYNLQVTTAYIGHSQMCKLRPVDMHNALGTIGVLDSRVLASKLDNLTGTTFFDVFIYSDLKFIHQEDQNVDDIIDQAVRSIVLTYQIATGEYGWGGDHFSSLNKYPITLFSNDSSQEIEAASVFKKLLEYLKPQDADRISFYSIRTDL